MDQTVVLCTLVAFILYYNTLDADFAYDDSRAIKTNPDVNPATPWTNVVFNDFWGTPLTHSGSHKSYRPLCVLSFRLNHAVHELRPAGYHLVNVLLHCAATALFTLLTRSLFPSGARLAVAVAGGLFATHPVHTEAVAGIVGRADVGAAVFFILSFMCYRRYGRARLATFRSAVSNSKSSSKSGSNNNVASSSLFLSSTFPSDSSSTLWPVVTKWLWLASALICAACSMLTKEHGVTVLAVCAVYDLLVISRLRPRDIFSPALFQKNRRGLGEGLGMLMFSAGGMLAVRFQLMGSKPPEFAPADNPAADSSSWIVRTLTFLHLPAFNVWLLVQPTVLSFDWSMEAIPLVTSLFDGRNLVTTLFYATLCYAGWSVLFSRRVPSTADEAGEAHSDDVHHRPDALLATSLALASSQPLCPAQCCGNGPAAITGTSSNSSCSSSLRSERSRWSSSSSVGSSSTCSLSSSSRLGSSRSSLKRTSVDVTVIALSMMVLPFIPATNLFFYVGFVVAERVLYIPSMGYCLLVALGCHLVEDGLVRRQRRRQHLMRPPAQQPWASSGSVRTLFRISVALVLVFFSMRTVRRNRDWMTEESLYRSGISINPPKAYGNLANILSSTGRKDEAEWAYKKALSYRNNMADVHYNLGILYQEQKRNEEAIQSYRSAIHYRPRMAMAHLNLGLVLALTGLKEEAIEVYRRCSQLDGSGLKDPRTHETTKISALFNLGRLYADDGQHGRAVEVYSEAIQRMPPHYQPQSLYNMLGEAYFKMERLKEAEHWYREALRVKADHIPAHLTYGKLLTKLNRLSEAEELFLRAKMLAPNDSTVYQHYGQYLSECERYTEAAEQYVKAATLAPAEYEIIFNAANTLRQAGRHSNAERYYRAAVKIRPLEATSHMNLGAMLHVNGKLMEAEQSYLEALRLKPDDHITRTNLQKLRHLLAKKGMSSSSSAGTTSTPAGGSSHR